MATFGDLEWQQPKLNVGYNRRHYVGTRAPSAQELEIGMSDLFNAAAGGVIADLGIYLVGFTNIPEASVAPDTRNCNAITIVFNSQAAYKEFLRRPIPASLQGISLEVGHCPISNQCAESTSLKPHIRRFWPWAFHHSSIV